MEPIASSPGEKPANGIAGLKHWRHDLAAGLLVSLISMPFSLGIAVASGAPPISGLISAIIAGLILPFLGGSYVTISGPAAGLAPALLGAMIVLGKGSDAQGLARGYPLLLCVIAIVGVVQIVLSQLKAARLSAIFPSTVVEAMLASIGLLIIAKQLPNFLGVPFHSHEFFGYLGEAPGAILRLDPRIFGLGVACLALIFLLAGAKSKWLKIVPPQVIAVIFGVFLAWALGLGGSALIHIPDDPFKHGLVLPNFRGLMADQSLWLPALGAIVTLTLIDGVESLATASAVDRIDPYRRKSDANRVLLAMGISNICSSVCGGLTIIPGGVKSKACIEGGGRTLWANFYNAIFLLIFLFLATGLINLIPLSALAAVLIYTGYKLCRPMIWRHMAYVGREQLLLFTSTVLVTLATDLLWGIAFGVLAKLAVSLVLNSNAVQGDPEEDFEGEEEGGFAIGSGAMAGSLGRAIGLFRSPVSNVEATGGTYHLYLDRPMVCFNSLHLTRALDQIPRDLAEVVLHVGRRVTMIDHTTCDFLLHFVRDFERAGGRVRVEGLDRMKRASDDPSCLRLAPGALASEHRRRVQALTRFGLNMPSRADDPLTSLGLLRSEKDRALSRRKPSSTAGSAAQEVIREIRRRSVLVESGGFAARDYARYGLMQVGANRAAPADAFDWWKSAPGDLDRDRLDRTRLLM